MKSFLCYKIKTRLFTNLLNLNFLQQLGNKLGNNYLMLFVCVCVFRSQIPVETFKVMFILYFSCSFYILVIHFMYFFFYILFYFYIIINILKIYYFNQWFKKSEKSVDLIELIKIVDILSRIKYKIH